MRVNEIVEKAKTEFTQMASSKVDGVCGFNQSDGGWVVSLEVLERRAIPDSMDVLGIYEVRLDEEGNLVGFDRERMRKRGDVTV